MQSYNDSTTEHIDTKRTDSSNTHLLTATPAVLRAGYGFWDTTHYPYGGCFRRATQDTPVMIIRPAGRYPAREREIRFADGRMGVADLQALEVRA